MLYVVDVSQYVYEFDKEASVINFTLVIFFLYKKLYKYKLCEGRQKGDTRGITNNFK